MIQLSVLRSAPGKPQLLRQTLFESMLLQFAGAFVGLLLARFCFRYLAGVVLTAGRQLGNVKMEANVLWFTLVLTLVTSLLSGVGPAISPWRSDLYHLL